jgi:glutamate-1-semialdehyde aminotransferase
MTGETMTNATTDTLLDRARRVLPGVAQTYSKGPDQFVEGLYPVFLESGDGCRVRDRDGREWIDYPLALGPIILGYNDPGVNAAVHAQVDRGPVFSLCNALEVDVAERLVAMIPSAEGVRFLKTGSEATTAAVRLARAYTGREHVAQCGYHGWHDWCIGHSPRNAGIPSSSRALTHQWAYNDISSLERILDDHPGGIAAIVMEPIGVEDPLVGFLEAVRDIAHRHGSLLIFDEIITGFRLAPGGAQEYFGVTPDLAAFGKGIANGYPLAAVVGRADIMEQIATTTFISSTFGGDAVSLAAASATLARIQDGGVCEHLWREGGRLQRAFNMLAARNELPVRMVGLAPRRALQFDAGIDIDANLLKGAIWQECLDRGILLGNANFISAAHDENAVDATIAAFDAALAVVGDAYHRGEVARMLRGKPPGDVFRRP